MTKVVFAAPAVIAGLAAVLAIGPGGPATRGAARQAVSKGSASQATPAPEIIDGRLDPQDIPNSTAYRLWLLAASESRTGAVAPTARTEAMLMDAGRVAATSLRRSRSLRGSKRNTRRWWPLTTARRRSLTAAAPALRISSPGVTHWWRRHGPR